MKDYKQLNISKDGNGYTQYCIERVGSNGQLCTTITENIEDVKIAAFVARVYNITIKMTQDVLRDINLAR